MVDVLAPILVRLRTGKKLVNEKEIVADIRKNVEQILNSRLIIPDEYLLRPTTPTAGELLDQSLVNYGIVDFQSLNLGDEQLYLRFTKSVCVAIQRFEKRLKKVSVKRANNVEDRLFGIDIFASLNIEPFKDVKFQSGLELGRTDFTVSDLGN